MKVYVIFVYSYFNKLKISQSVFRLWTRKGYMYRYCLASGIEMDWQSWILLGKAKTLCWINIKGAISWLSWLQRRRRNVTGRVLSYLIHSVSTMHLCCIQYELLLLFCLHLGKPPMESDRKLNTLFLLIKGTINII